MADIDNAIKLLKSSGKTCVLCQGNTTHTSDKSGIAPMLGFLADVIELHGVYAADKMSGKRLQCCLFVQV